MEDKEGEDLKQLGSNKTDYQYDEPSFNILETFENKYPDNDYLIQLKFEEMTSLCPKTGQPDFATINITYTPGKKCIESKSLKLYLFSYRQHGGFMESIVNRILGDLCHVCAPKEMIVLGSFKARGGIVINVTATYSIDG